MFYKYYRVFSIICGTQNNMTGVESVKCGKTRILDYRDENIKKEEQWSAQGFEGNVGALFTSQIFIT